MYFKIDSTINYLRNPEHQILTIEAIGKTAGFKSRSSMYLAFKRIKGQSPGDFKF